ncbi:glycosyltransferase [Beijerinckia sp. L45]|uniref:glycosyltransferase n=1 Tax=Beijerinckia sp. L45 TaxID=1641855 RepID=UPI00131E0011|nr:glycosyltransferase [Beijerinckia sp. L45]
MLKALTVATYPIDTPRHGGQIRSAAINATLRTMGWKTEHLCVFNKNDYPEAAIGPWNFAYGSDVADKFERTGGRADVDASDHILESEEMIARISHLIRSFNPGVFLVEQPWLWPVLKCVLKETNNLSPVVYSSHNHELPLLKQLLKSGNTVGNARLLKKAEHIESDLVQHSSGLICVCEADSSSMQMGHLPLLIAPNGVWPRVAQGNNDKVLDRRLRFMDYALFVGSAHPPNASGFDTMLRPLVKMMPPNQRIAVVGGVCNLLPSTSMFNAQPGLAETRIELLGTQSEDSLTNLISHTKGFILPITEGGGTNLKTAEALYSRKPIIATPAAFRGFEKFKSYPNVFISDEATPFCQSLVTLLDKVGQATTYQREHLCGIEGLTWPQCLLHLPNFLSSLIEAMPLSRSIGPEPFLTIDGKALAELAVVGWNTYQADTADLWSSEQISILRFNELLVPKEPYSVAIDLWLYNPDSRARTVSVFSRSRLIGEVASDSSNMLRISGSIFSQDFYDDTQLELFIKNPDIDSPSQNGGSDQRMLGVNLKRIIIAQVDGLPSADADPKLSRSILEPEAPRGRGRRIGILTKSIVRAVTKSSRCRIQLDTIDGSDIGNQLEVSIRNIEFRSCLIRGWALPPGGAEPFSQVKFSLVGRAGMFHALTRQVERADVALAFGSPSLKDCGFEVEIPSGITQGTYRLSLEGVTASGRRFKESRHRLVIGGER